jgi:hypothetical protein
LVSPAQNEKGPATVLGCGAFLKPVSVYRGSPLPVKKKAKSEWPIPAVAFSLIILTFDDL